MKLEFTDRELQTLTHALTVAAERFDENEKTLIAGDLPRTAEQFRQQAADTRALRDRINGTEAES